MCEGLRGRCTRGKMKRYRREKTWIYWRTREGRWGLWLTLLLLPQYPFFLSLLPLIFSYVHLIVHIKNKFPSLFCRYVGIMIKFWPTRGKPMHCLLTGMHTRWLELSSYVGPWGGRRVLRIMETHVKRNPISDDCGDIILALICLCKVLIFTKGKYILCISFPCSWT